MNMVQGFLAGFGGAVIFLFFWVGAHPTRLGFVLVVGLVVGAITAYFIHKREEREQMARLDEAARLEQRDETK